MRHPAAIGREVAALRQQTAADVASLRSELAAWAGAVTGLRGDVAALSDRVATLERLTALGDAAPGATIADAIATVASRLSAWEQRCNGTFVVQQTFEAAIGDLDRRTTAAIRSLSETTTPREAFALLQAAQAAAAEAVSAVQGSLATKVDRSDILRMQALSADLESFAAWKGAAAEDLRGLARTAQVRWGGHSAATSSGSDDGGGGTVATLHDARAGGCDLPPPRCHRPALPLAPSPCRTIATPSTSVWTRWAGLAGYCSPQPRWPPLRPRKRM